MKNVLGISAHILFGIFSGLSTLISRVLPVLGTIIFLVYELDQDIRIDDYAYQEIREFAVGFFLAIVILLCIKYLGEELIVKRIIKRNR